MQPLTDVWRETVCHVFEGQAILTEMFMSQRGTACTEFLCYQFELTFLHT